MPGQILKFVAYAAAQDYLAEKYGLRPVTLHTQRVWIRKRKFPEPKEISPSNKAFTEQQLDEYAEGVAAGQQ